MSLVKKDLYVKECREPSFGWERGKKPLRIRRFGPVHSMVVCFIEEPGKHIVAGAGKTPP